MTFRKPIEKMYVRELRNEIEVSRATLDSLWAMNKALREEVEALKSIDKKLHDFNFEKAKAEYERQLREGFDYAVASRQPTPRRHE